MGRLLRIHAVNDVRLDDYQRPAPGPQDVVVKMKACGICGSDLSYIKVGGMPREPGGTTALGHEGAGEIMFVGADVEGISVGQPVIVNPMNTPAILAAADLKEPLPKNCWCAQPAWETRSYRSLRAFPMTLQPCVSRSPSPCMVSIALRPKRAPSWLSMAAAPLALAWCFGRWIAAVM